MTTAGGSPISLTDLGKEVSQLLGAAKIARDLVSELSAKATGKPADEIQELSFNHVYEYNFPDEVEKLILECAYERGIDRNQVIRVIGVELRDQLLELNQADERS